MDGSLLMKAIVCQVCGANVARAGSAVPLAIPWLKARVRIRTRPSNWLMLAVFTLNAARFLARKSITKFVD